VTITKKESTVSNSIKPATLAPAKKAVSKKAPIILADTGVKIVNGLPIVKTAHFDFGKVAQASLTEKLSAQEVWVVQSCAFRAWVDEASRAKDAFVKLPKAKKTSKIIGKYLSELAHARKYATMSYNWRPGRNANAPATTTKKSTGVVKGKKK
jgi:hypothetical protein